VQCSLRQTTWFISAFLVAILEIDRVATDLEGKPVEWRISRCGTEHYEIE
jgi:hypothetical protein